MTRIASAALAAKLARLEIVVGLTAVALSVIIGVVGVAVIWFGNRPAGGYFSW
jgi:hypothetical protein